MLTRTWDSSNVQERSTGTVIYRTPYKQCFRKAVSLSKRAGFFKKFINFFLLNFIFHPDSQRGWHNYAYEAGLSIIKKYPISLILSTSPWTAHWIASDLSKATGIPWIADYRDPWTQDTSIRHRKIWLIRDKIHRLIEKRICKTASCAIHASETWSSQLSRLLNKKVYTIPNGFDPEDFTVTDKDNTKGHIFTLSYVGSFHFVQKLDVFLKGFQKFLLNNKPSPEICRLVLVPPFNECHGIEKKLCSKYKVIGKYIHVVLNAKKSEAVRYMTLSDVLLLFLSDDNGWYPTKFFEYLACGKQILATPDDKGVIGATLKRTRAGTMLNTSEHVAVWLEEKWKEFQLRGNLTVNTNTELIEEFNRRKLTQKLSEILNSVVQQPEGKYRVDVKKDNT